jgi:hypothetical protein
MAMEIKLFSGIRNVRALCIYRKPRIRPEGFVTLTTWHPISANVGTNFATQATVFSLVSLV